MQLSCNLQYFMGRLCGARAGDTWPSKSRGAGEALGLGPSLGGGNSRVMSLLETFARWCIWQTPDEGSEACLHGCFNRRTCHNMIQSLPPKSSLSGILYYGLVPRLSSLNEAERNGRAWPRYQAVPFHSASLSQESLGMRLPLLTSNPDITVE